MRRRVLINVFAAAGLYSVVPRLLRSADKAYKPRSPGEVRAQVFPSDYSYEYGDVRRYGMSVTASPSSNAAALQRCLNANMGASDPVTIPAADADYQIANRIIAPANTTIVLERGASLRWVSTEPSGSPLLGTATRPGIEVVGDNFRLTGNGRLQGPSEGTYVVNEVAIVCIGESAAKPRSGLMVADGIELSGWGSRAIVAQFTRGIVVRRTRISSCGYAGMQFLSCRDGQIQDNDVGDIGPGSSGNAYGISCSHDSRRYADDPNALRDGRQAANHFCIAFDVGSNTVHDIPLWIGIDFHGAFDCRAHDNNIYNCRHGICMQGSSDAAADFAGENNSVTGNNVTTRRMNGEATTVTAVPRLGISVNGGKLVRHRSVTVRNNTIDGYGDSKDTSFSLQHTYTSGLDISNNRVLNWKGYGCYSAYSDGVISDNVFGPVAEDGNTACIYVAIGGNLKITGNRLMGDSGFKAKYGVLINTPTDSPYLIRDNDFRAATAQQYAGHAGARLAPAQLVDGRAAD